LRDKGYLERRNAAVPLNSRTSTRDQRTEASAQLARLDQRDLNTANNTNAIQRQGMADETARYGQQLTSATTRRGQDITAADNSAQNQLAGQRVSFEGQRVGLEGEKFKADQAIQGFQARSMQRLEDAQKVLLNPDATPEQRKLAQSTLAALNGKTAADRLQAINLPDTLNESGQPVRGGQALIRMNEDGTIEQVPVGAQQAKNITTDPRALAIKNNTGLSMAEKQQQLRALGYQ